MSQNKTKILFIVILLIFSVVFVGCPDNQSNLGSQNEEFSGTYMARDLKLVEALTAVDSINFTVIRSTTYRLDFYEGASSLDDIDFCDHTGTLLDFGTGKVSFDPTSITPNNCDTLKVPRGTFVADFINHGDTVWIYKQVTDNAATPPYDSLYMMKIIK